MSSKKAKRPRVALERTVGTGLKGSERQLEQRREREERGWVEAKPSGGYITGPWRMCRLARTGNHWPADQSVRWIESPYQRRSNAPEQPHPQTPVPDPLSPSLDPPSPGGSRSARVRCVHRGSPACRLRAPSAAVSPPNARTWVMPPCARGVRRTCRDVDHACNAHSGTTAPRPREDGGRPPAHQAESDTPIRRS